MRSDSKSKSTVEIPTYEIPQVVGKALRIVTDLADSSQDDAPVVVYIPLSCIYEEHDDYIVCDTWIAEKKNLI